MEFSADEISQEIDDHVMEADLALIVPMDEIEGVDGLFCSHQQCGLLSALSFSTLLQGFPQLHGSAWDRPFPSAGFFLPFDQKDFFSLMSTAPHRHLRCWGRPVFLFDGPLLLQT